LKLDEITQSFLASAPESEVDFLSVSSAPWIVEIEEAIGWEFPSSFHELYGKFLFESFEVGDVEFFANLDSDEYEDIKQSLFRDAIILKVTLDNGYIHFAKSSDGSYDPICFNTWRRNDGDYEIVRLDHEAILQFEKIKVVKVIASSLKAFMAKEVSNTILEGKP